MGELSQSYEIRMAFNDKKMSNVGTEEHDLSEPFTGGAFDILVEVFQHNLIERGLISEELGEQSYHAKGETELQNIQKNPMSIIEEKRANLKNLYLMHVIISVN